MASGVRQAQKEGRPGGHVYASLELRPRASDSRAETTERSSTDREPNSDQVLQGEPGVAVCPRRLQNQTVREGPRPVLSLGG